MSRYKPVQLRHETFAKAKRIKDRLSERSGLNISMANIVERALTCLEDAHDRGAWLSPKEAAVMMEERVIGLLAHVAGQIATFMQANPGARLIGCKADRLNSSMEFTFNTADDGRVTSTVFLPGLLTQRGAHDEHVN